MTTACEADIFYQPNNDPPPRMDKSLGEKNRRVAQKLNALALVHGSFGALDGASLSYSMVKYSFDLLYTDSSFSSSDLMHNWMTTPGGIAVTAIESVFLIAFSLMGNVFKDNEDDEPNLFKRYIAFLWPYFRDAVKGLKNAYKGIRGGLQAIGILAGQDLRYLMAPIGILLGVLSIANRIWHRRMRDQRKAMQARNAKLFLAIQKHAYDAKEVADFRAGGGRQTAGVRAMGFLAAAYGGVVDGLYLYMGIFSLATFTPPILIALVILSVIYTLSCIAVRLYDEYDYQRRLVTTEVCVELALCGEELQALCTRLQESSKTASLQTDATHRHEHAIQQQDILNDLESKIKDFEAKQKKLRSLVVLSNSSALWAGLRSGLAVYGSIASVMFAIATIQSMLLIPFPPALLVACVLMGIPCLIGFIVHSLITNARHRRAQEPKQSTQGSPLSELLSALKDHRNNAQHLELTEVNKAVLDGMAVEPSPQVLFFEGAEVVRSIGSGVAKGQKSVDFALNPLQEPDDQGHYHDTPIMHWLTVVSSTVYGVTLGLRAYARGFSQDRPLEQKINEGTKSFAHPPSTHRYHFFSTAHEKMQPNDARQNNVTSISVAH